MPFSVANCGQLKTVSELWAWASLVWPCSGVAWLGTSTSANILPILHTHTPVETTLVGHGFFLSHVVLSAAVGNAKQNDFLDKWPFVRRAWLEGMDIAPLLFVVGR
jgi:hypothetical protein